MWFSANKMVCIFFLIPVARQLVKQKPKWESVWLLIRLHSCFGAPPTSLCSPSRCCRGLLLLRLNSTPPLHSTAAAAAAETAAAACAAGPKASPQQQQHTASPVINLSHVGKVKSDGQEGSQDTAVYHYFFVVLTVFLEIFCVARESPSR